MRLCRTTVPSLSRPATLQDVFPRSMPRTAIAIRMLLPSPLISTTIATVLAGKQFIPLGHTAYQSPPIPRQELSDSFPSLHRLISASQKNSSGTNSYVRAADSVTILYGFTFSRRILPVSSRFRLHHLEAWIVCFAPHQSEALGRRGRCLTQSSRAALDQSGSCQFGFREP